MPALRAMTINLLLDICGRGLPGFPEAGRQHMHEPDTLSGALFDGVFGSRSADADNGKIHRFRYLEDGAIAFIAEDGFGLGMHRVNPAGETLPDAPVDVGVAAVPGVSPFGAGANHGNRLRDETACADQGMSRSYTIPLYMVIFRVL